MFTRVTYLDNYPYLEGLVEVRNTGEHDFKEKQIDALNKHFLTKEDKIVFARSGFEYAADVWKFVKAEVDKAKQQNQAFDAQMSGLSISTVS